MRADGRFDGHIVQGHVDGVGRIRGADVRSGTRRRWWSSSPAGAASATSCHKGSVAVDGISLTVASLEAGAFTVALIPYTLEVTNLRAARAGRPREPRGRRHREVRRAPAPGARRVLRRSCPSAPSPRPSRTSGPGRMVVVVDDEDRENEGDLTIAAEKVTPEVINFMARHGRGLICLPMTGRAPGRAAHPAHGPGRARTAPASARRSASPSRPSRARRPASRPPTAPAPSWRPSIPATKPADLARPGHMFPLRAVPGRRPAARGPDRGRGGPRPPGRALSGRRHLRDHGRGRDHGAGPAASRPSAATTASG